MKAAIKTLTFSIAGLLASTGAFAGQLVDMELLGRGGYRSVLPTHFYGGERYVEAVQNQEFRVRLHNRSGERVLAVLSVDGVNAITGQTADTSQRGYVLQPYQSVDVDGWRKSERQTAAFYFTHIADSYAARTNRPNNVGVIGIAVFRERNQYPWFDEDRRYGGPSEIDRGYSNRDKATDSQARSQPAPQAESEFSKGYGGPAAPSAPLGTGHGRREYNRSYNVQFEREDYAFEVEQIRYDSRNNLVAMGVIQTPYYRYESTPQAFPGGYVPDPVPSSGYGYRRYR